MFFKLTICLFSVFRRGLIRSILTANKTKGKEKRLDNESVRQIDQSSLASSACTFGRECDLRQLLVPVEHVLIALLLHGNLTVSDHERMQRDNHKLETVASYGEVVKHGLVVRRLGVTDLAQRGEGETIRATTRRTTIHVVTNLQDQLARERWRSEKKIINLRQNVAQSAIIVESIPSIP